MTLTLYHNTFCPYAQRARLAVVETNLNVEEIEIDLSNKPEWYIKDINPVGKVPALKLDDGQILIESLVIAQYILEKYDTEGKLISNDPLVRAKTSLYIDQFGNFISKFYTTILAEGDKLQEARDNLFAAARKINVELEKLSKEGPYIFGDQFTLADIVSAPHFISLSALEKDKGFTFPDTNEYARFNALRKTLKERPSVQRIVPSVDGIIASYDSYRARQAAAAAAK